MHEEAGQHGDAVPAQLPPKGARVLHVQDLPCYQEDNPKREVPVGTTTLIQIDAAKLLTFSDFKKLKYNREL